MKDETSRSIINRSGKLMFINVLSVILLFLTNFLLVRLLGEKIYGSYVIINVWLSVLNIIVVCGMDDLFITVLPKKQDGYPKGMAAPLIFKWALKICLLVLAAMVGILSVIFLNSPYSEWFQQYAFSIILFFGMMVTFNFLSAFFRGINLILKGQFLEKIVRAAIVLLAILFLRVFQLNIGLQAILVIQAVALFICIFVLVVEFGKRFRWSFNPYNPFDATGKSNFEFLGISLLYFLSTRLDILMLTTYSTPEQVGHYNVAARISDILAYPSYALYLIVPTFLSREWMINRTKAIGILKKIALLSFAVAAVGILFLLFLGKDILVFFGKNFVNSFWPMIFLSLVHLFSAFSLPFNTLLMVTGKQRFSLLALFVFVLFVVIVAFFMIPRFGAAGASLTMLCGSIFYLFFISFISLKLFGRELSNSKQIQ